MTVHWGLKRSSKKAAPVGDSWIWYTKKQSKKNPKVKKQNTIFCLATTPKPTTIYYQGVTKNAQSKPLDSLLSDREPMGNKANRKTQSRWRLWAKRQQHLQATAVGENPLLYTNENPLIPIRMLTALLSPKTLPLLLHSNSAAWAACCRETPWKRCTCRGQPPSWWRR